MFKLDATAGLQKRGDVMVLSKDVMTNGPLKGIKVIDWTVWQFGPVSTSMMGDMGAEVIKLESLDGDPGRGLWRAASLNMNLKDERNAYFEITNRNKRSVAINLKTDEGRKVAYKLVEDADVFVQNFRQGVAERLSMGYDDLKSINPNLIYGAANGYGPAGPDSHLPSFDGCGQARSGLMMSASEPGVPYPTRITQGVSDQIGAIILCQGILAALVSRSITGKGQKVETSHLSANMWLQGRGMTMSLLNGGQNFGSYSRDEPTNPLSNTYKCSDGKCILMMHLQPDRYWEPLLRVMDLQHLQEDRRFSNMTLRAENAKQLVEIFDQCFATKSADEWDYIFRQDETDFIYAKVQPVEELVNDPQVIANDYITDFDHPVLGSVKMCNHPNLYSDTPAGIWREAPELGQHTEEILISEFGYTWEDIQTLREANAIL